MTEQTKNESKITAQNVLITIAVILLVLVTLGLVLWFFREEDPDENVTLQSKKDRLTVVQSEIKNLENQQPLLRHNEQRVARNGRIVIAIFLIGLNYIYFRPLRPLQYLDIVSHLVVFNSAILLAYGFVGFIGFGSANRMAAALKRSIKYFLQSNYRGLQELIDLRQEQDKLVAEISSLDKTGTPKVGHSVDTGVERVYISEALLDDKNNKGLEYGRPTYFAMLDVLKDKCKTIANNKGNVWARDFMPIRSSSNRLIQFTYAPSYMTDSKKWLARIPDPKLIHKELGLDVHSFSELKLDGGNVELIEDIAIVSDRVFRENPAWSRTQILDELRSKLELEEVYIIPEYPYDFTGHVDGLVRFIDENTVLINDYSKEIAALESIREKNPMKFKLMDQWFNSFRSAIENAALDIVELPTIYDPDSSYDSAYGLYLNFLRLKGQILMPTFGDKIHDKLASDTLSKLYNLPVHGIDALELSREGGVINCVSWV